MQHEAALGLHRAAEVDRRLGEVLAVERQLDLLEQVLQLDVDRLVDDQAERALLGVLAQVDHGAGEGAVAHARHGDQELVREVDRLRRHGGHFIPRRHELRGRWRSPGRSAHCDDGQAARHRAGLVPPRPARGRPRRAVPRAARRRAGSGAPSSSTATSSIRCRAPTGGSSSSATASRRSTPTCAALGARARQPRACACSCATAAPRDEIAAPGQALHVQAVYANHDDEPHALARDAARARRARRPRHRAAHLEGPRGLRAQRGADRQRQALQRVHAVQERLAEEARRRSSSRPIRSSAMPPRWRRRPSGVAARRAVAGRRSASSRPTCDELQVHAGSAGGAGAARRLPRAHRRLRHGARLPGGQGPELPVGAPALRHGLDPRGWPRASASTRAEPARAAPRSGCPS